MINIYSMCITMESLIYNLKYQEDKGIAASIICVLLKLTSIYKP